MKERIRGAIEKKMEERPDDEHLKQQATLIHSARITTIHSFCLSVIREHFHSIDLDPSFRIGEEGELRLMRRMSWRSFSRKNIRRVMPGSWNLQRVMPGAGMTARWKS